MYGLHTSSNGGSSSNNESSLEIIDIILVSGVGGNQESTWAPLESDEESLGFEWFLRFNVQNTRVSTYKYPLFENDANIFSPSGVNGEASRLLKAIYELDRVQNQRIVLVGHDIGGILIKQALIEAAFGGITFRNIFHSISALIFIGCPHIIDSSIDLTPSLNRLLILNEELDSHPRTLYAASLATVIWDINAKFKDVRAQLCVYEQNVVSNHEDVEKRVFELAESKSELMTVLGQWYIDLTLPHSELARGMPSDVATVIEKHIADYKWVDQSILRSSATYTSAPRRNRLDQSLITYELPMFRQRIFQKWESCRNTPFLAFKNIENVDLTRRAVSQQLDDALSWSGRCYRFDFRFLDSGMKTVGDLLCNVLKATLSRFANTKYSPEELGWNLRDLLRLYRDLALMNKGDEEVWILIDFDKSIDSSAWLLDELYSLVANSDLHFRVIFINSPNSTLELDSAYTTFVPPNEPEQPLLDECSSAGSHNPPQIPGGTTEQTNESVTEAHDVQNGKIRQQTELIIREAECQTLQVIRHNPRVATLGLELFGLLQKSDLADEQKELIVEWLNDLPKSVPPTDFRKKISNILDARIESTFKMVLSSNPLTLSDPYSTTDMLELVALAIRPLTYLELANLEEARKEWETGYIPQLTHLTSISSLYPGVFKLLGNEVRFSHPQFRRYLFSEDSLLPNLKEENLLKRHSHFARLCLEYLTSSHGVNRLEAVMVSSDDVGVPESREDFLSYAVQFWLKHASLACSEWTPEDSVVRKFLSNTHLLDLWGRVYWHRTSSATRPSLERSGPLATLVEFAPMSTLHATLDAHKGTDWIKSQYFNAILAAARVGKPDRVGLVLEHQSLDYEMFDLALQAALQSQDETTISMITSKAPETYPGLVTIPAALRKALRLGQKSVINQLVSRVPWATITTDNKKDILATAISGNNVELIKTTLLEQFQDLTEQDFSEAILQAVQNGHAVLSGVLMVHFLRVVKEDESKITHLGASATTETATCEAHVPIESQDADITTDKQGNTTAQVHDRSSEESTQSPPAGSHYVQLVLNHAIDHGQHNVLQTLIEIVRDNHSPPTSIKSLLEAAILQCRPRCLSRLLGLYENMSPQSKLDMNELLELAASNGNVAAVHQLLQGFAVIDDESFPRVFQSAMATPLAAPEIVRILIERGRPCVTTEIFTDQLNITEPAIDSRSTDLIKLLISEGADLNKRSCEGATPLFNAAYYGRVEIVETLIKAGAELNMAEDDDDDWWPVHAAYDNVKTMKLLLDNGANVNARTRDGSTALYLATKWGYEDCVVEILKHKPEFNCVVQDDTIMFKAVETGKLKIAELLLDAGENPCHSATKAANAMLLHQCVINRYEDLLKRLLLYSFDLEHVNTNGRTALNCFSSEESIPSLRLLLIRGANLETQDDWNETPLANAVRLKNVELASFFISEGANVNATIGRRLDSTPLLLGCSLCSSPDILQVLIDNGANTKFVSSGEGGTIFQAVCQNSNDSRGEVLSYLLENDLVEVELTSNFWGSNLNTACLMTDPDVIDKLIKRGAHVDGIDKAGRRPVHFALYRTVEHVKMLCDRDDGNNADLFALDYMERNALHFAVISGRLNLVEHVIKQRPGLAKEKDCDGWTPLFWAARDAFRWKVETSERAAIIEALLRDGADIMDVDERLPQKWAAYHVARYYGLDNDIIKLVTPTEEQIAQSDQRAFWDKSLAARARTARRHDNAWCDICLLGLVGIYFACNECWSFCMCFKCYRSRKRDLVHDPHSFVSCYENDQYENSSDEETASSVLLDSAIASEDGDDSRLEEVVHDSETEDDIVSDSDESSF